jgi:hypothetical protein
MSTFNGISRCPKKVRDVPALRATLTHEVAIAVRGSLRTANVVGLIRIGMGNSNWCSGQLSQGTGRSTISMMPCQVSGTSQQVWQTDQKWASQTLPTPRKDCSYWLDSFSLELGKGVSLI